MKEINVSMFAHLSLIYMEIWIHFNVYLIALLIVQSHMQILLVELVKQTVILFFNMTIGVFICALKVITLILTLIVYCLHNVILINMEIMEQLNASVLVLEAPLQTQILDIALLYALQDGMEKELCVYKTVHLQLLLQILPKYVNPIALSIHITKEENV